MSQTGPRDTPHTSRLAVQGGLGELLLTKMLGLYDGFGFATSCQHRAEQGGALRASRRVPVPREPCGPPLLRRFGASSPSWC